MFSSYFENIIGLRDNKNEKELCKYVRFYLLYTVFLFIFYLEFTFVL